MARKVEGMERQLFEDTKKRLNQIFEYTIIGNRIEEADDDDKSGDAQGGDMPPMDGGNGQIPPMGGPNAQSDGMPVDGGGQMPPADPNNPMTGGGNAGGGVNGDTTQTPDGFNPQPDMTQQDFNTGGEQPTEGDDVVDVSELTDAQEDTEKEIEQMDNKFSAVMKQLGAFEELIRNNDDKIEQLKAEFERRNPTQVEKLSMNTAKGGPFNVSPEEYWDEKQATSNYSIEDDDNGKEQGQYVITANDVNGSVDWKSIADSLDDDDFMYHQTLNGVLKV